MIYNENLTAVYGKNAQVPSPGSLTATPYRPIPTGSDYGQGFFVRYFCQRIGSEKIEEINSETYQSISRDFFLVVSITWKISGPRYMIKNGSIIESKGVEDSNVQEIKNAKVSGIDLSRYITNPIEFWRGR